MKVLKELPFANLGEELLVIFCGEQRRIYYDKIFQECSYLEWHKIDFEEMMIKRNLLEWVIEKE